MPRADEGSVWWMNVRLMWSLATLMLKRPRVKENYLVDEPVLEALGLGHQFFCAAVPVAGWSGVPNQIPVIYLKDDRLDQPCTKCEMLSAQDRLQA